GAHGDDVTPHEEQEIQRDQGQGTQQPELLSDGGENVVRLDLGYMGRMPKSEPVAEQTSSRQRVVALDRLVPEAIRVPEGIQPVVDANADAIERPPCDPAGSTKGNDSGTDIKQAAAGDVEHGEEHTEEE